MEYKIISSYETRILEKEVNTHLQGGWKLQGGVSITTVISATTQGTITNYAQAIVKGA